MVTAGRPLDWSAVRESVQDWTKRPVAHSAITILLGGRSRSLGPTVFLEKSNNATETIRGFAREESLSKLTVRSTEAPGETYASEMLGSCFSSAAHEMGKGVARVRLRGTTTFGSPRAAQKRPTCTKAEVRHSPRACL